MKLYDNTFTIEEVRNFWDSVAHKYESTNETVGYVHYQRYERAMLYGNFKPRQSVLNIWSRTGLLIPYLRRIKGLKIVNREVSPGMRKHAEAHFPKEQFAPTDLNDLSEFKDNTFDRIVSLETLEHTPKPLTFLSELYRILKPNGVIVMSLPPRGFEGPTRLWDLFFDNHGEGPHQFLNPKEVKKLLKEAGFHITFHKGFIMLPLGNDTLERWGESILTTLFGWTPLVNFGVRHFYVAKK